MITMEPCTLYNKLGNFFSLKLEKVKELEYTTFDEVIKLFNQQSDIDDDSCFVKGFIKELHSIEDWIKLEADLESKSYPKPCLNCEGCMNFIEKKRLLVGFLFEKKDLKWIIEQEHFLNKAKGQDKIFQHIPLIKAYPQDFNRTPYEPSDTPLVYLDHNIIDKFHKTEGVTKGIRSTLVPDYAKIQYVYSPSHIEEIKRMNNSDEEEQVISTIRKITSSLLISHYGNNQLSLAYEDPKYVIKRVLKIDLAADIEHYRTLTFADRDIFFPERVPQTYTSKLTYESVFNDPTVLAICSQFPKHEIVDDDGNVKHFYYTHQAVYGLVKALDNLGYKREKGKGIKSSVHDIEHIVYAAGTNIFVSEDYTCRERANFIYKRLGFKTEVMNWEKYKSHIESISLNQENS